MTILGIGVDIIHLPRIAAIIERWTGHKLARRILSVSEFERWTQIDETDLQRQVRFLSVRYVLVTVEYYLLTLAAPVGRSKRQRTKHYIQQSRRLGKTLHIIVSHLRGENHP